MITCVLRGVSERSEEEVGVVFSCFFPSPWGGRNHPGGRLSARVSVP